MTNLPHPFIEIEAEVVGITESPWTDTATEIAPSFRSQQWGSRNMQGYSWEKHMLQQMGIEISPISQTR